MKVSVYRDQVTGELIFESVFKAQRNPLSLCKVTCKGGGL